MMMVTWPRPFSGRGSVLQHPDQIQTRSQKSIREPDELIQLPISPSDRDQGQYVWRRVRADPEGQAAGRRPRLSPAGCPVPEPGFPDVEAGLPGEWIPV
ncbi:hypothetical protein LDENG_00156300 [Lucifuga dentata]|nr:hypothetical protein LDENG_00156300 [Lucifuga dentata]